MVADTDTTPVVLETAALSKRFGGVIATAGVNLAIREGELRCIIGPNGAGKSTLFQLLCGIYRPDNGEIIFRGRNITRVPAFRRARFGIGMTFQQNRAFHNLTVRQNLDIAMGPSRRRAAASTTRHFQNALDAFDLTPHEDAPTRELPHHKLQWLEIAMVLAGEPAIALLDEPTAGMSPDETAQTAQVLRQLNENGLTIVVVEHDITFVRDVAGTVTVLHQGKIFAEGSVSEITAHEDVRSVYLGRA